MSVLQLVNFHFIHNYIKATASSGEDSLMIDVNETSPTDDQSTTDHTNIQLAVGISVGVVTIVIVVFVAIIVVIKKCKQQKEAKDIALPER